MAAEQKTSSPVGLWCIECLTARTPWLMTFTLRRTRREAWDAYWQETPAEDRRMRRGQVRAVRVVVAPEARRGR